MNVVFPGTALQNASSLMFQLQRKEEDFLPRTTEMIQGLLRIDMRKHAHYVFASSLTLISFHFYESSHQKA